MSGFKNWSSQFGQRVFAPAKAADPNADMQASASFGFVPDGATLDGYVKVGGRWVKEDNPNADMIQKDSQGLLDQAIRQIAAAAQKPAPKASDAPREPGESLGIVAPMDGRLGRWKA